MSRQMIFACIAGLTALVFGCDSNAPDTAPEPSSSQVLPPETEPSTHAALAVMAWNVESGGNEPAVIAGQLQELAAGFNVICLNEVSPSSFEIYQQALADRFDAVRSETGRSDRLMIFFERDRFDLLDRREPMEYRDWVLNDGNHRSPLYVRLEDREIGRQFIVMTTHLARGNADLRTQQAVGLREWARDETAPIIAIGDFNMDYDFRTGRGNDAFVEMLRDNVWRWVRPDPLIDTNWADRNGDGIDDYPDSMLDFVFVSGLVRDWNTRAEVVVRDGDFPDDETTSDHRPIAWRVMTGL